MQSEARSKDGASVVVDAPVERLLRLSRQDRDAGGALDVEMVYPANSPPFIAVRDWRTGRPTQRISIRNVELAAVITALVKALDVQRECERRLRLRPEEEIARLTTLREARRP